MRFIILLSFNFLWLSAYAQQPVADFTLPSNACKKENINIQNQSVNAVKYEWDFCEGDLSLTPTATSLLTIGGNTIEDIEIVFDGTTWFGFAVSRGDNSIIRLDFGNNIFSIPTVHNLGNIGSSLNSPTGMKVINEGGQWYGFVSNYNNDGTGNLLVRINFGNSLSNILLTTQPVLSGQGGTDDGLDIVYYNNAWYIFYAGRNAAVPNAYVGMLKLSTATSIPSIADKQVHIIAGANYIAGCKLVQQGTNWYGYVIANQSPNSLKRLSFGTDLFNSSPVIDDITNSYIVSYSPYGLVSGYDQGNYYLFVSTLEGNLVKVNLGTDLSAPPVSSQDLGNLGILKNTLKFRLIRYQSQWIALLCDYSSTNLFNVVFPNPACGATMDYSSMNTPLVSYSSSGTKSIDLRSYKSAYEYGEISKTLNVGIQNAPDISFSSTNNCAQNSVNFNSANSSGDITIYSWDFGDGGTSSGDNASHIYSAASKYAVMLEVTAGSGCQNFVRDTLQIFNPPQANFSLPTSSPICTNQNYTFTNTSTYDVGSNPTWQWSVNGTNVSSTKDLNYLIPSAVAQNIILTAAIPGCNTQSLQTISMVQDGSLVSFNSPAWACQSASTTFTNTSTGTITNFTWNFGDGNTSSQTNGSNTYLSAGVFPVTLAASNSAGCQNSLTKSFSVYSKPQPDFAIEAPPYSCANYPAQFDNNTPALTDSNIATWAWSFGDTANGTSNQKNPSYTYTVASNYNVSLQATSNFGCTATEQKSITINTSPQAGFTNTPACVNQNTIFTNASTGNIVSYQWVIQSTTFIGASPPPYIFKSTGTYPVSLTATSGNGCKNQMVKNINVPIPPVMDFIYASPCADKPTIFQEANPEGSDPSVSWNWNFGPGSGTGSPTSYTFSTAGGYSVTLTATRTSGCAYSTSKNVAIYEGPIAKFTPSTQGGAPPLTVAFNNESQADSYFWQFDYQNSTSTDVSPAFTYSEFGEYKVLLTASNIHSCADTVSTKIYIVIPEVDLAMKNFSLVQDPSSSSSKPLVTISNLGNIPLTNPEVEIDLGGNVLLKEKIMSTILPGKSLQQLLSLEIVSQSLGYICAEVSPTDDINIYNDRQCLSMTDNDVLFSPYPNPASGTLNFDWISSDTENVTVTIFKSTGQVAFQQNFQLIQSGINQLAIDISSLSSGLYLVQFTGAKTKKAFNVMVIN